MDIQGILETDRFATLALNGSDSLFIDGAAYLFSSKLIWAPMLLMIIYLVIKNNHPRTTLLLLLAIALTVVCCDQIPSVVKHIVMRPRPTHEGTMLNLVDTVNGYRGGAYGFFSNHASNSFGIVTFLALLVKNRWFTFSTVIWAILNSLARAYLGAHYIGDILCGTLVGVFIGALFYGIYHLLSYRGAKYYTSTLYTKSGYLVEDLTLFQCVLYGTYIFIILFTCLKQGTIPY